VITGRFVTRQVDEIARVVILAPDGTTETLEGTPIHPIWSVDRQDWIPLGELSEGEQLQAAGGVAVVLSLTLLRRSLPVYNIEVHGEHVYQVGELGLLVHNTYPIDEIKKSLSDLQEAIKKDSDLLKRAEEALESLQNKYKSNSTVLDELADVHDFEASRVEHAMNIVNKIKNRIAASEAAFDAKLGDLFKHLNP
jgi:hypothetical protein